MTDRELMQMALCAIEIGLDAVNNEKYDNEQRYKGYPHLMPNDQYYVDQLENAIQALRDRLAQPDGPVMYLDQKTMTLSKPLKHEWVGLTHEEVFRLSERIECCKYSICAAEELLKEKNT